LRGAIEENCENHNKDSLFANQTLTEHIPNTVPMRISGPKRDEVTGVWRKLHNEELNDLYSSPSIIIINKSRRMRWEWHVAQMGERGTCIGCWWESRRKESTRKTKT
jgi:hypothetical protein